MISIIDYGAGNLRSVEKAIEFLGGRAKITKDKNEILSSEGVILPGVGSFGEAALRLAESGLGEVAKKSAESGQPFLGICLGMQLLFDESEESIGAQGLSILKGEIVKIPSGEGRKIPHMGWNSLDIRKNDGIFSGIEQDSYVYFVHSYYLKAQDKEIVSAKTTYGPEMDVAVSYKNISATQFHPEKSGEIGLKILKNFLQSAKEI